MGGMRDGGFTLIELMIVVVIIGVLAAIAIPRFGSSKERSYLVTMQSDLRNLATAQENYLVSTGTYYDGAVPSPDVTFFPSSGVTITVQDATPSGWSAVASHVSTAKSCAIFFGSVSPVAPATPEGTPTCD